MVAGYVALSPLTAWTGRHRFNLGELGMVPAGGANLCGAEYKVGSGREALHHQIVIATVCFPLVALDARLGLTLLLMTHRKCLDDLLGQYRAFHGACVGHGRCSELRYPATARSTV